MVVFQDLRISSNGMEMYIDAIIAPYDYYEGEYIDNIVITDDNNLQNSKILNQNE